jgi:protein-S-isoprenylcysteine O-methyltransferase Ste14
MDWFWRKPPLKAKLIITDQMTEQKDHAEVKIHPPILLLLHLGVVYLSNRFIPFPSALPRYVEWLGYGIVLSGLGFAFSAMVYFAIKKTTLDPHGSVSAIVTDGPYRFSRNPIYLGLVSVLIGLPLVYGSLWGLAAAPVFILFMNWLVIQYEEAYLQKKFGGEYTSYKSRVRRWL